jgi:segregation and condensation protein A
MREVVDVLERRGEERRHRFARSWIPQAMELSLNLQPLSLSLADLLGAVDRVLRIANEPALHEVVPRAVDVAGAMEKIRAILALRRTTRLSEVVGRGAEPWQVLSALLALLEMAKLGELHIAQAKPFASVEIRRDTVSEAA